MGYEAILVSSGAIAVETNKMSLKNRPSSIRHKQAAASVGQCGELNCILSVALQTRECQQESEGGTE